MKFQFHLKPTESFTELGINWKWNSDMLRTVWANVRPIKKTNILPSFTGWHAESSAKPSEAATTGASCLIGEWYGKTTCKLCCRNLGRQQYYILQLEFCWWCSMYMLVWYVNIWYILTLYIRMYIYIYILHYIIWDRYPIDMYMYCSCTWPLASFGSDKTSVLEELLRRKKSGEPSFCALGGLGRSFV